MIKQRTMEIVAVLILIPTTLAIFKFTPMIFNFFIAMALNLGTAFILLEKGNYGS